MKPTRNPNHSASKPNTLRADRQPGSSWRSNRKKAGLKSKPQTRCCEALTACSTNTSCHSRAYPRRNLINVRSGVSPRSSLANRVESSDALAYNLQILQSFFLLPRQGRGGILLRSVVSIGVQQNAKSLNAVQTSPISAAQVTATIEQSITALNAVEVNAAEATQSPSQSHSHGLDYPSFQFLRLPHLAISQQGHFVLPDAQASKQPLLSARR